MEKGILMGRKAVYNFHLIRSGHESNKYPETISKFEIFVSKRAEKIKLGQNEREVVIMIR